jgi:hypothetical protein
MAQFENEISAHFDARIGTLASIKARSLGADTLVLSALTVLAYAQLEGGVKDLCACLIKHVNARNMAMGEIAPSLLKWRNRDDIRRLRSIVNFDMVGSTSPFASVLQKKATVNPINRRREFNQMGWNSMRKIYDGFGLDSKRIEPSATKINDLRDARNQTAHHGLPPQIAAALLEAQVRDQVSTVEDILTDLSVRALTFFRDKLHRRP